MFGEIEITEKVIKEFEEIFFEIINTVFTPHAPKATVKIGLIYLAKIMDLYPEFTATYLNILLSCPENVRSSTLDLNPIPGTEEEVYVSGVNTEKYRTYGAPEEWNSLFVAQALQKAIQDGGLDSLEWPHIEIFDACTKMDFKPEDLDQWIEILSQMKNHFLISLCYRDFSLVTIRILKKFFFNIELQSRVISECLEIFISMLRLLYQPDTETECKENARDFLEVLHDGSVEAL